MSTTEQPGGKWRRHEAKFNFAATFSWSVSNEKTWPQPKNFEAFDEDKPSWALSHLFAILVSLSPSCICLEILEEIKKPPASYQETDFWSICPLSLHPSLRTFVSWMLQSLQRDWIHSQPLTGTAYLDSGHAKLESVPIWKPFGLNKGVESTLSLHLIIPYRLHGSTSWQIARVEPSMEP